MQIFKIREGGFAEIRKIMLIQTVPLLIIVLTILLTIGSKRLHNKEIIPYYVPLVILLVGFGVYRGVNRQKALFNSYTLKITNNLISREQVNTPPISIYFIDIKEIFKHKNGSFTVIGKDPTDVIGIPPQIDSYSQVEMVLQGIKQIVVKDKLPFLQKYQSLTGLIIVGLMLCVFTVNNKIIVALTGTTLVALMIWSFNILLSSKNVDSKAKNYVWWSLIVLVSVITVMISRLTCLLDLQKD